MEIRFPLSATQENVVVVQCEPFVLPPVNWRAIKWVSQPISRPPVGSVSCLDSVNFSSNPFISPAHSVVVANYIYLLDWQMGSTHSPRCYWWRPLMDTWWNLLQVPVNQLWPRYNDGDSDIESRVQWGELRSVFVAQKVGRRWRTSAKYLVYIHF